MTRSKKLLGVAALSMFGLAAVGLAADEGKGPGGREGRGFGRHGHRGPGAGMFRGLDLTEAQKDQLKALHEQQREAMKPAMEQQKALRDQIRQALESANPDATRIGQLEIQAHRLRQQMKAEHEKMRDSFVNILTPEQKAQWEKRKQDREQRREQFREKRGQRPDRSQS
jgi:periplasmic protein CpxP/Spy